MGWTVERVSFVRSIFPSILGYVFVVLSLSFMIEPNFINVIISTSPILLHLIFLFSNDLIFEKENLFWLTPLIFPILFILIWSSQAVPELSDMDGPVLFIIQIVVSYFLLLFVYITLEKVKRRTHDLRQATSTRVDPNPKLKEDLHVTKEQKKYYQKMAEDYYKEIQKYADHMKKLQDDIGNLEKLKNMAKLHEQEKDKLKRLAQEKEAESEDAKQKLDETQSMSDMYRMQIEGLQKDLQDSHKYQEFADEVAQKNKTYQNHIKKLQDKLEDAEKELQITKENFLVTLRTIEDKAKAINFAIGRVYATKKGGSKEIRNMLHINRQIYDTFSKLTQEFSDDKASTLLNVIVILYRKLNLYEEPEKNLFKLSTTTNRVEVKRNKDGTSKILDVLATNDKDPVMDYYKEAKEICIKLIKFLQAEYGIEHQYIAGKDLEPEN